MIEDAETAIERKEIWFSLHCLPVDLLAFLINKYSLILESKIHTSEETFEGPYNCPSASCVTEEKKKSLEKSSSKVTLSLTNY